MIDNRQDWWRTFFSGLAVELWCQAIPEKQTVENVYADYDKSPFGSKYPGELIFVAKKQ